MEEVEEEDILEYMRHEMDEDVVEREEGGNNRFMTDEMFDQNRNKPEYFSGEIIPNLPE